MRGEEGWARRRLRRAGARQRGKKGRREGEKRKEKRGKRNGKKEKEIEEKKMGRRERKKEGGGRCAPAATAAAVGHAGAGHGRWGTRSGGGKDKERREKRGGIRGGRSRRVALDGKEMGRGLNSGVGLFGRGSGD